MLSICFFQTSKHFTTKLQINPATENVLSDSKPILPVGLFAACWSKNSGNEELLLYVNLHNPLLILLTYGDHNPKLTFVFLTVRTSLFCHQNLIDRLLTQPNCLSCLPAWQRRRRRRRARPPRLCHPPSSWTSSWAKCRVTTPGSGRISKVGGATNTHLDKMGM